MSTKSRRKRESSRRPMTFTECDDVFRSFVEHCVVPKEREEFLAGFNREACWTHGLWSWRRIAFLGIVSPPMLFRTNQPIRIRIVWGMPTPKAARGWEMQETAMSGRELFNGEGPAIALVDLPATPTWLYFPHDDDSLYAMEPRSNCDLPTDS